ncbi:MAG: SDR family oxidoreductase [Actinomycetota bacterium]|nr:SDR family oxidoreductase [Actinomycetota bacterium]
MRLDELQGRRFVVCGASRGLGRATAEELISHGASVLVVSRNPDAAVAQLGPTATGIAADLASAEAADRIDSAVNDVFGGHLDGVLVNSGGPPAGRALEYTDAEWSGAFELLLAGPIRLLRLLAPLMSAGSVVFITSSSVRQPIEGLDSSNVLRPAVAALVKVLARELAPTVRVNSLAPGRFDTDRVRELDAGRAQALDITPQIARERAEAAIPLGRYGEPVELARVAAFLLSSASSYVNGSALQVDGGSVTAVP